MWTQRRITLGFLFVTLAVLVNSMIAYRSWLKQIDATNGVTRTHETLIAGSHLIEAVLNAETGQRGYLLTNSTDYLEPYQKYAKQVSPSIEDLKNALAKDGQDVAVLGDLESLVNTKLQELEETIKASQKDNALARSMVQSHLGKNYMDKIRKRLADLEISQLQLRKKRIAVRDESRQNSLLSLAIGTTLTLLVIGLAYVLNKREFKATEETKQLLQEANHLLETRVIERTESLNQANLELSRSNRELQDFAFVASHDLQEPLRKIQAFGDLLKNDFGSQLGAEGTDFIDRMQNASRRMDRLIKDLLAYSRVTTKAQPFAPTDLNVIVTEVLDDLATRIKQTRGSVTIETLPTLEADALQMQQLLQNLIGNALKFHRPDVPPIITVSGKCEEAQELSGSLETTPQMCHISVSDNGIGFDEKYLDRIFTPFQRLHRKDEFEGTGMGLAICRKVVERHGGTITAKSQPGVGTTFLISLPAKHAQGAITE